MKTKTTYICDKCGEEFNSQFLCETHEMKHEVAKSTSLNYLQKDTFPNSVTVEFTGGTTLEYFLAEEERWKYQ